MKELLESLRCQTDALALDQKNDQQWEAEQRVEHLEGQLTAVDAAIPLWDRLVFFHDTEDEQYAKDLAAQIDEAKAALEQIRKVVTLDEQAISTEFAPLRIGQLIAQCQRLVRDVKVDPDRPNLVQVPPQLRVFLQEIEDLVIERWIPDCDPNTLRITLLDAQERRRHAGEVQFDDTDPRLGWRPITQDELIAAVSHELESGHGDRFRHGGDLAFRVESALAVYPPLALQIAAHETLGVLSTLGVRQSPGLTGRGAARSRYSVPTRPLLLLSMERLVRRFQTVFPGVMPSLQAQRGIELASPAAGPFAAGLERRGAAELVYDALSDALMCASLTDQKADVSREVGLVDRVAFWADTDAEESEEELAGRIEHYRSEFHAKMERVFEMAREEVSTYGPFELYVFGSYAIASVADIHTDGGESRFRQTCSLNGRGNAVSAVRRITDAMGRHYGAEGSGEVTRATIERRLRETMPGPGNDAALQELTSRVQALHRRLNAVQKRLADVRSELSSRRVYQDSNDRGLGADYYTLYKCVLRNHSEAVHEMSRWNQDLLGTFGTPPTLADLIEHWLTHRDS